MEGVNFITRGIDFRITEHDPTKQDVLVPGKTIKNINGVPLVGEGNLNLAAGIIGPGLLSFHVDENMHLICENGIEGTFGLSENKHFIYQ